MGGQRKRAGRGRLHLRGAWTFPLLCAALLFLAAPLRAEDIAVPVSLQAVLLAKVAEYDRNFAERAGDKVHVLLVVQPGNGDSTRAAAQMESALKQLTAIGGLPHDETTVAFQGGTALVETARQRHATIVYITPGMEKSIPAIKSGFSGENVLTVGCVAEYVPAGVVLGFDVVSGKPKLLVNLTQAKLQNVSLRAEILKLTKVFE